MISQHFNNVPFIFLLMTALGLPVSLHAEPIDGLGMWVWSYSAYATPQARQRLIRFCEKNQIRHLDVHTRIYQDKGQTVLRDGEAFRALIRLAGEHNITTAALRGDPKMFFSRNHEKALCELRAIIAFSRTFPGDTLFRGIKYDVEPYLSQEWRAKGKSRETVMKDYLSFLRLAGLVLDEEAPGLWLAADTPFWWDKDELILDFGGRRKRFNEHVQDLTDFITIMSYRRSAKEVLHCVQDERTYAEKIHKVIFPSLETIKLKKNPQCSFYGMPREKLWKVVPQLMETAKEDPAIGGVMIHCYRGLAEIAHKEIAGTLEGDAGAQVSALRKSPAEKTRPREDGTAKGGELEAIFTDPAR
jgi:hypothetical protein